MFVELFFAKFTDWCMILGVAGLVVSFVRLILNPDVRLKPAYWFVWAVYVAGLPLFISGLHDIAIFMAKSFEGDGFLLAIVVSLIGFAMFMVALAQFLMPMNVKTALGLEPTN